MIRRIRSTKTLTVSIFAIASLALLFSFTACATAAEVHVYSHSFGAGELSLTPQSGIAVNQETGGLYTADTKHSRVAKFSAAGTPEGALATLTEPTFIAVDNSAGPSKGDIYVVTEGLGTVTKLSPLGVPVSGWGTEELGERKGRLKGLAEIAGIDVDSQGDLWILSRKEAGKTATMREFDQADAGQEAEDGESVSEFMIQSEGEPSGINEVPLFRPRVGLHGIAVGADHLYAFKDELQGGAATLVRLTLDGKGDETEPGAGSILSGRANGVTIDPVEGDLYVSEATPTSGTVASTGPPDIQRYTSAGAPSAGAPGFETFGGAFEGPRPDSASVVDGLKTIGDLATLSTTGSVYAVDPLASDVAIYTLEEVEPPSVTLDPPASVTQTSANLTGHINPNAPLGSSRAHEVVWKFECTPACPGQANGHFEADGVDHTVATTIEGLEAGTEYSITLVAENRGGKGAATRQAVTAPAPPGAETGFATGVVRGEATLNGTVNSNGLAATYIFEYTTKTAFEAKEFTGAQSTPTAGPLPAPAQPRPVSARIADLQAGVAYLYRVVATNSLGTVAGAAVEFRAQSGSNPPGTNCPNQVLRTEAGARLGDCRGYELVTPTDKNGALIEPYTSSLQAAPDGSGVTWYSGQTATGIPSPPAGAHQDFAFHLSTLTGESWTSQRLLAPEELGESSDLVGLSTDERYALVETARRGGSEPGLYVVRTSDQTLTPIVPPQVGQQTLVRAFSFDGASADDLLFFFESRIQLTPNAIAGKDNLYVWNRVTDVLSLAGALPGSKAEAPPGGSFGGAYSWWEGEGPGVTAGGAEQGMYVGALHAISESGDFVYFTAGGTGQLYLRRGLTSAKPATVRLSVPNTGVVDPNGEKPAAFQEATPNGEKVFLLSSGKLTQDANTGPSDEGSDLYRYDAGSKTLVDVTPLPGGAGARVQGLVGSAEDGQSGYLVAKGVLAEGGVEGESNLYHFAVGSGGSLTYRFVARLSPPSNPQTFQRDWSAFSPQPKTARVSADGGTAIFMSARSLIGPPSSLSCIYGGCMELYRYSMAEGSLSCLSCNPTGEGPPLIGAELSPEISPAVVPGNAPNSNGSLPSSGLPRNLSASGNRVFFQSSESLLPEDENSEEPRKSCLNQRTCVDVYEWEAVGTGSCKTPNQAGGCLYLVSTGESGQSSYFLNASADGSSVFILTSSSLAPLDEDELSDVYDTRVNGGLASQHMSASPPCSSAEACKGPSPTPSTPASAGTSSFQGPGNIEEAKKCRSGVARKHGRCVKKLKKHQKKKRHKKTRHRSSAKKHQGGAK